MARNLVIHGARGRFAGAARQGIDVEDGRLDPRAIAAVLARASSARSGRR
jgi:hypothetical protein